jgi:DNA-directed RNA polymerase specialized sigma24 family protein
VPDPGILRRDARRALLDPDQRREPGASGSGDPVTADGSVPTPLAGPADAHDDAHDDGPPGRSDAPGARPPEPVERDFVRVYRQHYPRLLRALRLAGAATSAEDLAQEAFAVALSHWWRVRRGTNPAGYPYRVAFRLLVRQRGVAADDTRPAGARPGEVALGAVPGLASTDGAATVRVAVAAVLAAMPPRRRQVAVLCLLVGERPAEAARALDLAEATVRKHLELARADLRAQLGDA